MKTDTYDPQGAVEDEFWTEHIQLFTAQFPTYYTKPQTVWGRFHRSEEEYRDTSHEIIPISERRAKRTYVMMQPYVREPKLTLTVGLYNKPKTYHDQESSLGEVIGSRHEGFREAQVGDAQAWYYHADDTIVLWECFFWHDFRRHPFADDVNMRRLWQAFERWLMQQFPAAHTLATTSHDPIAESREEYHAFLTSLGYAPLTKRAFGKHVR
jgi:hypothetical protein